MAETLSYINQNNIRNIVYITSDEDLTDAFIFRKSCELNGVNFIFCNPSSKIEQNKSKEYGKLIVKTVEGKFDVCNEDTIIFLMKSKYDAKFVDGIISLCEKNDFPYYNEIDTENICADEKKVFELLEKNGISANKTFCIDKDLYKSNKLDTITNFTNLLNDNGFTEYPIIIKTVVDNDQNEFICADENIAYSFIQFAISKKGKCFVKQYCKNNGVVKVQVFCKSLDENDLEPSNYVVLASMKCKNGETEQYELKDNEKELVCNCAKALGLVWCEVSICNGSVMNVNSVQSLSDMTNVVQYDNNTPTDNIVKICKDYFGMTNSSYINEKNKTNILFITKNPLQFFRKCEYGFFYKECKKLGVNLFGIDPDEVQYKIDGSNLIIDDYTLNAKNTVAFFRHAIRVADSDENKKKTSIAVSNIKHDLSALGIKYSNNSNVANICRDKYKTHQALLGKVPLIPTLYLNDEIYISKELKVASNLLDFLKENDMKLPLVVKVTDGTQGVGVFCCKDENILVAVIQYLLKTKGECIVQQYCEIDNDVRVHVLCKSFDPKHSKLDDFVVVGAMKRNKADHDFRTNFSVGASVEEYTLTESEQEIAKMASKAIGAVWCGVDICYDKLTKANYVIEVNSSPALRGISGISKVSPAYNIVKSIKEHFEGKEIDESKEEIIKHKDIYGKRTSIRIKGIGECEAVLDSGNAGNCSIRTKKMTINGDEVEWEFKGKSYKSKIVDNCRIQNGGDKGYESRPIILLDFDFNDKTHKDIKVSLKLNPHRADYMLLSAGFLGKNKIIIDPSN